MPGRRRAATRRAWRVSCSHTAVGASSLARRPVASPARRCSIGCRTSPISTHAGVGRLRTARGWDEVDLVADALVELGAPPTVYVVSDLAAVDGRFLPLEDALRGVLSQDSGSLVSCVPGTLALFEGEVPGDRYPLVRDGVG